MNINPQIDPQAFDAANQVHPTSKGNLTVLEEQRSQLELFEPEEISRPELNIAKWANVIFISPYLKSKVYQERRVAFSATVDDEQMEASITVTPHGNGKHKTLTTTSYRVFLGLVQIWELQGKPSSGAIEFSGAQLAHILGWQWGGATGERISEQLKILRHTSISWERLFRDDAKVRTQVDDMSILGDGTYVSLKNRTKKEKFQSLHRVVFGEYVRANLINGVTKPINYHAYISIGNEAAANLYTQIDIYLSGKNSHWQRRALALLYDDLGYTGARYQQKKHRRVKLTKIANELNGKELSTGKLVVTVEPTADGKDYKIVAARIPRIVPKARTKARIVCDMQEAGYLADEICDILSNLPNGGHPHHGYIRYLARYVPAPVLRDSLSLAKGDYLRSSKKTITAVFVGIVKKKAAEKGIKLPVKKS